MYARLGSLIARILGPDYRYVTGNYIFIVANTDSAAGWAATGTCPCGARCDPTACPRS